MIAQVFGPPTQWPDQDLIAFSAEFDAELAVLAYCSGAFPMALHESGFDGEMGWWSPVRRGVFELDDLRVTRSMLRSAARYTTTIDAAFDQVLARCADPGRPGGWIDADIVRVYSELAARGLAHSVETWDADGRLVGGLYGVAIRGLFAGESMFHDARHGRDASKVALARLITELRGRPDATAVLDVQWVTDHLASLGASELDRSDYLVRLDAALAGVETVWSRARRPGDWRLARTG